MQIDVMLPTALFPWLIPFMVVIGIVICYDAAKTPHSVPLTKRLFDFFLGFICFTLAFGLWNNGRPISVYFFLLANVLFIVAGALHIYNRHKFKEYSREASK